MYCVSILSFILFIMIAELLFIYIIIDLKYGLYIDPCFRKIFFISAYSYLSWRFKITIVIYT